MSNLAEVATLSSREPSAPDVAALFRKAGVAPERTKQLLCRPQEDVATLAKHAAKIV
jgi:hypothetical protein